MALRGLFSRLEWGGRLKRAFFPEKSPLYQFFAAPSRAKSPSVASSHSIS